MFIADDVLDKLIAEDVPYFDLTTHLLGIGENTGVIRFFSREEAVLCGTEEAARILNKLGIQVTDCLPSGTVVQPEQFFLAGKGLAQALHMGWKVCQNLIDNTSAIATKTKRMIEIVREARPQTQVVTTRKSFPGIKALCLKAVLAGGGTPHRLGLSETVLVFKQHVNFLGGWDALLAMLPELKSKACEKKIIVEADSIAQGLALCKAKVDGIQFDKVPAHELSAHMSEFRRLAPGTVILAAGGINETNAAGYAEAGVDAIVTTSLFNAKPIDIGVKIEPL